MFENEFNTKVINKTYLKSMLEYLTISKGKPKFPNYLNFQTLRDIGISHLQTLSGKIWTDYNLHDPGVTILEVLCYAITDLGYRNNLDIEDLLALNPNNPQENNFFTPDQILTCNPVTEMDLRKRLIDIPGVRNAWLEKFIETDLTQTDLIEKNLTETTLTENTEEQTEELTKLSTYHPAIYVNYGNSELQHNPPDDGTSENATRLHPRGLYTVYIDLDKEYRQNACTEVYKSWSDTLDQVKAVLCRYRNLCEDIYDIVVLGEEEIGLCSDIELEAEADPEDVLVEIYIKIQEFLSPRLQFYTLQELLDKGKGIDEIFAGRPSVKTKEEDATTDDNYASHGFIDTAELEELTPRTVIYTSDLYQEILKIPGIAAVKRLSIANFLNGLAQSQSPWQLQLTKGYSPVLGIERSKITLFKGVLPISPEVDEVQRRYYEQQAAYIKVFRTDKELDLSVPPGSYYDLADHYSIQHDFPLTYGISEDGLPATATALRKAQARQLKGYLVLFDQLLANYLVQLAHVRDLFSWEVDKPEKSQTSFIQELDFPDKAAILGDGEEYLKPIQEEPEAYRDRRNRFLDHLLGRFAESFADYVVINYQMIQERRDKIKNETEVIRDKAQFLQDYPMLSRDRFRAFDYCNYQQVWDTTNVSGFQKRVSRLLGFDDFRRRNLCHYQVGEESGQFISFSVSCGVENKSLTSLQTYPSQQSAKADREKFLLLALHGNFYQNFTYSYFYHYGLEIEVVDKGESLIARYESYFLSQAERITALNFLINNLRSLFNLEEEESVGGDTEVGMIATSTISQEDIIKVVYIQEENLYYFQLEIPIDSSPTSEIIKFEGIQRYFSESLARKGAIAILEEITNRQNYRPILFRQDNTNTAERETANPSNETKFTHYGYALIDDKGKILAESGNRLSTPEERDIDLQSWLSNIQLNHSQFQFTVEKTDEGYFFTVENNTDNPNTESQILLKGCQFYTEEILAWKSAANFAENLRYLKRYVSPVRDKDGNNYTLGIVDSSGNLLAIAPTQADAFTTFKQLNSLEEFLEIDQVQIDEEVTEETSHYRYRLVDREGITLLQSIPSFEDENTARNCFYQDVLGVLFEPGIIEPVETKEGFGFRILSKPRERETFRLGNVLQSRNRNSAVATSPQFYPSESERDGAIEHLFLLVRTARLNITWNGLEDSSDPSYIGRIYDQNNCILLEGKERYNTPELAWKQGNIFMELAGVEADFPKNGKPDTKNFRLIDPEVNDSNNSNNSNNSDNTYNQSQSLAKPYGWELTNKGKDQILATHYYTSKEERNKSIQTLQKLINNEGFHVLEHILLRPRTTSDNFLPICIHRNNSIDTPGEQTQLTYQDPYSFWITIILPYWSERFRNIDFRRFVERTLRMEAPAHVALKIAWVNVKQMKDFETIYRDWLEQLAQESSNGSACNLSDTLNHLIVIISQLRNIYPQGILYDPQVPSTEQPIILNQSPLGTASD